MSKVAQGSGRLNSVPDAPGAAAPVKGSVRAARERLLEVQRALENGPPELRQQALRDNPLASQFASPRSSRRTQPQGSQPTDATPAEAAARQPSPQQWPLKTDSTVSPPVSSGAPKSANKPPRPPRPSNAMISPPTYPDSRSQYPPGEGETWQNEDNASPAYISLNPNRPLTTSSASTNSSLGEIPDFPVPTNGLVPPRRTQNLGPPPSARRGPSSYYSQLSYVSPIAEESENRESVGSYASSNVIPSGIPEFYLEEGEAETPSDEEDTAMPMAGTREEGGIVRQVSLGKKTKPTLTTIKGGDTPQLESPKSKLAQLSPQPSSLGSGSPFPDATSMSSSEESLQQPRVKVGISASQENPMSPNPWDIVPGFQPPQSVTTRNIAGSPPIDPRVDQILGGLEKGGALDPTARNSEQAPKPSFTDRIGQRRPPKLNVDTARDAEVRSSLTSLPDLIRRATRLAANLDRGKTASKLGMDWVFANGSKEKLSDNANDEKEGGIMKRRSEGSLSGILASFPNPSHATPTTPNNHDQWHYIPSSQKHISAKSGYNGRKKRKRGRRCCGMPLWGFIMLTLLVVVLIAAAIVVPVVLIVLPRRHHNSNDTNSPLELCKTSSPCENGGTVTVQAGNTCGCICANGFTGPRCLNPADVGCSSTSVPGQTNATVGLLIPPLLEEASSFSIPLNASTLLSIFASTNTSCAVEDALITFTGFPNKRRSLDLNLDTSNPALKLQHRNANHPTATTSGLLLDGTATATITSAPVTSILQTAPGSAPTSTSDGNGTSSGSSAPGTNGTALSFAKVGILFILQESGSIALASEAQSMIENYLTYAAKEGSDYEAAQNVSLGQGLAKIDLWDFVVTLANGTEFGVGAGFNGTVTSASPTVHTAGSATAW